MLAVSRPSPPLPARFHTHHEREQRARLGCPLCGSPLSSAPGIPTVYMAHPLCPPSPPLPTKRRRAARKPARARRAAPPCARERPTPRRRARQQADAPAAGRSTSQRARRARERRAHRQATDDVHLEQDVHLVSATARAAAQIADRRWRQPAERGPSRGNQLPNSTQEQEQRLRCRVGSRAR